MNADTRARVEAFRRALELAARERSGDPFTQISPERNAPLSSFSTQNS